MPGFKRRMGQAAWAVIEAVATYPVVNECLHFAGEKQTASWKIAPPVTHLSQTGVSKGCHPISHLRSEYPIFILVTGCLHETVQMAMAIAWRQCDRTRKAVMVTSRTATCSEQHRSRMARSESGRSERDGEFITGKGAVSPPVWLRASSGKGSPGKPRGRRARQPSRIRCYF